MGFNGLSGSGIMTTQNLALFQALNAKMSYLDTRQRVLAQNVANADTPGYIPRDLSKVDFGSILRDITGDSLSVRIDTSRPGHMTAEGQPGEARQREAKLVYEVAPAGNEVSLEEQMMKVSTNAMDYSLITTIYQKNVGMIRTALGRQA